MTELFKTYRDPLLSLFQSAVVEVARNIDEKAKAGPGRRAALGQSMTTTLSDIASQIAEREYKRVTGDVPSSPPPWPAARELSKAGMAQVCAEWGLRYIRAFASGDDAAITRLKDEFTAGTCDPAWITTLEAYRSYFGPDGRRKAVPYIRPASVGPKTIEIKPDARVALMGDWGTGASPAMEILKSISNDNPDIVVHLGDIYYSGTPAECKLNFVDPIDAVLRKQKRVPVYSLSGNHDMYCGGAGLYGLIQELNDAPFTQPASFFCLRSADEKWQLLAMDTGLHDDNPATVADVITYLEDDELAWHCDRMREFGGRTILLSHHQLFSSFSPIGPAGVAERRSAVNPRLLDAFKQMVAVKDVAAWFWGHEHTLSIYQPFAGLARGRCLGHGAVPVSVIDEIYKPVRGLESVPSLLEQSRLGTTGGVYNHGYALLAFAGNTCSADYYQITSKGRETIYTESFS
jgi:Calcineurin-like phosphoesterase